MNNLQEFTNGDIKLPVHTNQNSDIEFYIEKAITATTAVKNFKIK